MVDFAAAAIAVVVGAIAMILVGALMSLLKPLVSMASDVVASGFAATLALGVAVAVVYYLIVLGYL